MGITFNDIERQQGRIALINEQVMGLELISRTGAYQILYP